MQKCATFLIPCIVAFPLERHHLFPRAWLEKAGETDLKVINQMANYALLEWPENISISDDPPSEYVNEIRPRFEATEWKRMSDMHALPERWETMSYESFLKGSKRFDGFSH
jgi:hypothetical protein